jgi:1-acyl-sn-glycerol-3-phosphate acyltransferase
VRIRRLRPGFPWRAPTVPGGVEVLEPEPKLGPHYDTEWARSFYARWGRVMILEGVMRPAVAALTSPDRVGIDRLEGLGDTPVIFAANHHSHLDSPVLLTSIPEPWRHKAFVGAAADYFFRTRVTAVASALTINAIPIERTRVTRRSAEQAGRLIGEGWSMIIFPEGGRSVDEWGRRFRGGAAYLSSRTGAPVVPVHLEGTSRLLRRGAKVPRPSPVRITFGKPVRPEPGESANRMAERIEQAVAELADEATTDWWQARRRASAGTTPPLTGPDAPAWRRAWALGDRGPRRRRRRTWPDL